MPSSDASAETNTPSPCRTPPPKVRSFCSREIRQHFSGRNASPEVPRKIQLSVGIAAKPPHAKSITELMRYADEALYRAKREGRSRVSIYVEDKMTLKSNFYPKAQLERLSKLSSATGRTEASLLREALETLLNTYRDEI